MSYPLILKLSFTLGSSISSLYAREGGLWGGHNNFSHFFLLTLFYCHSMGSLPLNAVLPQLVHVGFHQTTVLQEVLQYRSVPIWTMGSVILECTAPPWIPLGLMFLSDFLTHCAPLSTGCGSSVDLVPGPVWASPRVS